jgi:hypothetical protein
MSTAHNVTATFTLIQHTLSVAKSGSGTGTIAAGSGAINCGATCSGSYNHGTSVTLTEAPSGGSTFTSWSGGGCSGNATTCVVTVNADTTVTATFTAVAPGIKLKDNDPSVAYNGWADVADAAANGGFYRMSSVKNDKVTWTSSATKTLTWVTRKGPDQGKASLTIDGTDEGSVDLYAASAASFSKAYTGLTNRAHTVVITVLGTKNAASTGFNVRLDAFVVGATTTQESDPAIQYDTWKSTTQALATDGTFRSATVATATVTVRFTGTSIDWITRRGKPNGMATVSIDGVNKGVVDLYQKTAVWQSPVTYAGLSTGAHTMVISVLGQKNAAATGTEVLVDGFIVHTS